MCQRMLWCIACIMILTSCQNDSQTKETGIQKKEVNTNEVDQIKAQGIKEEEIQTKELEEGEEVEEIQVPVEAVQEQELEEQSQKIAKKYELPEGFVYVDDIIPTVELEIRYYTDYNFVGEKIQGYHAPFAILTTQAAQALKSAAQELEKDGYHIKIYDAYRPQKAVNHFVNWSLQDDATMKEVFYPSMEKSVLFTDGYISKKSRHSRGSTTDLTIVDKNGVEIDMGGYFDMLDTRSNYDTDQITQKQHENREYLRQIMDRAGFDSIRTEWWHFQLRNEPYQDTYFDFDIE